MKDPNFDIAFSIGEFHIYWYAILMALGIAAALLITDRRAKGKEVPKDIALDLCILGLPFGILGARFFACLSGAVAWSSFFNLSDAGLSFFGGMAFAAAAILVYLKHRKVSVDEMLDLAAPGVFTGVGIAVWGDFFNRIHYGPLVQKAAHKWFPLATIGNDLKIHYAAFFYEFLLCVILVVVYYTLLRKRIQRKRDRFLLMTLAYCLGRFGIDCIRQDLVMVGAMAFDQICEILIAVLCLVLLLLKPQPKTDQSEDEQATPPETEEAAAAPTDDEAPQEEDEPLADADEELEPETTGEQPAPAAEEPFSGLQ